MKKIFRYLGVAIGTTSTLAVVAFITLYIIGEHDLSAKRAACVESEDFVAVRSQLHEALASRIIDKPIMDRENENIARAEEYCANGQMKESRALLMNVVIDASIRSDGVYARKANTGQNEDDEVDPQNPMKNPRP
jgi:hypothetical protein